MKVIIKLLLISVLIAILVFMIARGDSDNDITEYKDVIFERFETYEDNDSYVYAVFKTEDGEELKFVAHKIYKDKLYEGGDYDLLVEAEDFLRPDNEINEADPYNHLD